MDFLDFVTSFLSACILAVSSGLFVAPISVFGDVLCGPVGRDLVMQARRAISPIHFWTRSQAAHSGTSPLSFLSDEKVQTPPLPKGKNQSSHVFSRRIVIPLSSPSIECHFGANQFDSTKGFPGEGPNQSAMTIITANVGSVRTNPDWKGWQADVLCLQETRIGKNNVRTATFEFHEAGFEPVLGPLLPGIIHKKGWTQTPCGGTAVLGPKGATRTFDPKEDVTGLFSTLMETKRCAFAWTQVSPIHSALVVSVYATTGASQDEQLHSDNDNLFANILAVTAQFGSIPVIVAGDFQATPLSYPSIAAAVMANGWCDPLATHDNEGLPERPLTFSRDGLFSGVGEGCSSIDGILLNRQALFALRECEVLETFGRQHRPVRCSFSWSSLSIVGFVHYKAACLDLSDIPQHKSSSPQPHQGPVPPPLSWNASWEDRFSSSDNPDLRWDVINEFCIQSLLHLGASWVGTWPSTPGKTPPIC